MSEDRSASGAQAAVEAIADVEPLRAQFGDRLVTPDHPDYDEARRVWNGMIDRRPVAIARCRGVADVIGCVNFARENGLPLAIRGGGHNVAGFGTCDDGLVVDLSALRGVRVDLRDRTVRVGPGATWADVDRETQPFGLAVPGGIVSTTGVAGLTLGGGQGWLRRTFGMTCDHLLSADVVTADGRLVVASEDENDDLFRGLRGGGGNFGVVTSFEFQTRPVGPLVALAATFYSAGDASRLLERFREFAATASDAINLTATFWTVPSTGFPEELHGKAVLVIAGMHAGPPAEGEPLVAPLRSLATPLLDLSGTLPFSAVQQMFDPFFPANELRYYWKSVYVDGLPDDLIRILAAEAAARPSSQSMISLWALGGALSRRSGDGTGEGFLIEVLGNWTDRATDEANIAWARNVFDLVARFGHGRTNFNFPGLGEDGEQFVRASLGSDYDALRAIKREWDPDNLFRLNQNIAP